MLTLILEARAGSKLPNLKILTDKTLQAKKYEKKYVILPHLPLIISF
jgi:hypothetical protein